MQRFACSLARLEKAVLSTGLFFIETFAAQATTVQMHNHKQYAIIVAMPHHKPRPRTYARNRVFSRRGNEKIYETDSWYFLKLALVLLAGTFWLKFAAPVEVGGFVFNGLPIGMIAGLTLVYLYERLQANRRIWYAVLIVTALITYFLPAGIII